MELVPIETGRDSDPLDLELQMIVSYSVGAINRTWILGKSNQC